MIKRWVYVALAFGLGMSAMSCENQKFNDVKVDVDRVHVDDNLKRTTNIETVFGETLPREIRKNYYMKIGYSETEAEEKVKADEANFVPNLPAYYTYEELLMLDAGSWFNNENLEEALPGLAKEKQYISTLEDLIMYSKDPGPQSTGNAPAIFHCRENRGNDYQSERYCRYCEI